MIDVALLSWLLAAAPADASARVAIMPPFAPVADAADNRDAQSTIRKAISRIGRVRAIEPPVLARLIASAADSGISCDAALADCATRIGAFGGVDFVVVTRIESGRATLALHDCADGRELRKASALLGDGREARDSGLAALALAVLGEGVARGKLEVRAPADGVVIVDGVDRGRAPLALVLDAGVHEVSWRSAGGELRSQAIEVPAAGTASTTFAGVATRAPSTLVFVGGGGVALGALLAVGAGVGAWAVAPAQDERARFTAAGYNDAIALGRVLLGVSIGGIALAAAGGGALALAAGSDAAGSDAAGSDAAGSDAAGSDVATRDEAAQ